MSTKSGLRQKTILPLRLRGLALIAVILIVLDSHTRSVYTWMSLQGSLWYTFSSTIWLYVITVTEALRQLWLYICEGSAKANSKQIAVVKKCRALLNKSTTPVTRQRSARLVQRLIILAVISAAAGKIDGSPHWWRGLIDLPTYVLSPQFLPYTIAIVGNMLLYVGIYWVMSRGGYDIYQPGQVKTRFSDVWGQDQVVDKVRETVMFLENPDEIERQGGYVPGGILLWGPPGTGKTLIAEAIAGETGKPYVFVEPGAFQAMFMGVGIMKVKGLFKKLRKLALSNDGVVVFFDEADALGSRSGVGKSGRFKNEPKGSAKAECSTSQALVKFAGSGEIVPSGGDPKKGIAKSRIIANGSSDMGQLQALLTEISGLSKPRGWMSKTMRNLLGLPPAPPPKYRILIIMATNMPDVLDEALLRPGRIDRVFRVGYPSGAGRVRTYQGYLDKVKHNLTPTDIEKLSALTPYATGASIKDVVNEALIGVIRDGRKVITWADLMKAKRLKELGPGEGVEYIERERHAVAVHEACHGVVAVLVRSHLKVDIATINKGGTYLGMVASVPPSEQFTAWKTHYEADIMVALASLVGERMFFDNDSSSGVRGDLLAATQVASLMESQWGMGERISSSADDEGGMGAHSSRKVEERLRELYDRTELLLAEHRAEVLALAHALEVFRELDGADVEAIVNFSQGPSVNGSVYALAGCKEALEEYHERAKSSHVDVSTEELDLPVFNGLAVSDLQEVDHAIPALPPGNGYSSSVGVSSRRGVAKKATAKKAAPKKAAPKKTAIEKQAAKKVAKKATGTASVKKAGGKK